MHLMKKIKEEKKPKTTTVKWLAK